jgi:hypothetical protein
VGRAFEPVPERTSIRAGRQHPAPHAACAQGALANLDFLTRWPTLPAVRRASRKTLETFFHVHNCRRAKLVEGRLESIRRAVPLTDDPGIIAPHRLLALMLVAQLRSARCDRRVRQGDRGSRTDAARLRPV